MPDCRKPPGNSASRAHRLHNVRGRDTLAMSVIVEEPASMRESRLQEQEKHPEDIKPRRESGPLATLEEQPLRSVADPESPVSRSESSSKSRSASSVASTAPSSDNGYERHNSQMDPQHTRSSESRSRHHSSPPSRHTRDPSSMPSHDQSSTYRMRSDLEYTPRSKTTNPYSSSSDEEEDDGYDHQYRRQHVSAHSSSRPKASSIPPSQASAPSRRERGRERVHRHQSPHRAISPPPYRPPEERPRSKSSTRLDSIHSPAPKDVYDYQRRPAPPSYSSSSREKCRPKSSSVVPSSSSRDVKGKRQLPPFREPYTSPERDDQRSKLNSPPASRSDQERVHRRMPSRHATRTASSDVPQSKSSSKLASLSETELNDRESRRLRAFRDASPPPRQRSTSNPKPMSQTHVDGRDHRQVASCREAKTPVTLNPKLLSPAPAKDRQQPPSSQRFLSARDPTRTRSTSLLPKKSPKPASYEDSMPRSVSASSLSSLASTPSPRLSVPNTRLRLRHYEGRFQNRRKQTLFYFSLFPPEKMVLRGVVLCLHGIGDHCRRNVALYERLCREGFGVITYDLLNHGVSDLDQHKTRAHVGNFSHLVEDTNDFVKFAKRSIYTDALRYWRKHQHNPHRRERGAETAAVPELPLVIAGTSFGSLVGIHTVLSGRHKFHAAVWGSPTVGVTWNPLLWAEAKLAKPLAAIIPTAKMVPAVQHDLLCRDPKFLRRFKADPLTSMDMMTTRTGHESLQAMIQLQEDTRVTDPESAFCAVPTLFLAGSADSISDQQAAIKFFGTMGNFDKEFKLFDGLFHMVYEEPEREDVFRYLAKWLHRRFPVETRQ